MSADSWPKVDYARLMKQVERVVSAIEDADDMAFTVRATAEAVIRQFRDQLGISGGRIYRRVGDDYVLQGVVGEAAEVPAGLAVPASYPPIQRLLEQRTLLMEAADPLLDRDLEARLGVEQFAAIEAGDREYLLAFDIGPTYDRESVLLSLGILRASINQKIRREQMAGVLQQARQIQSSILPRRPPSYPDFDIFGQTVPMEIVGGDHYDFIRLADDLLGIAIADVSGHGLPAALLVRDVYMGMRMALSRDYKITRTLERLNAIIHQSSLTSRFVSMFYGELEADGTLIYVNAGHPPPILLAAGGDHCLLTKGGAVLGPIADATYQRGFERLRPGDLMVLYTDGIVEARGRRTKGQVSEYGLDRLIEVVRESRSKSASAVAETVLDSVQAFSGTARPSDDRTVVVVKRLAGQRVDHPGDHFDLLPELDD